MQSNKKKRICIVVSSLGIGGAERSAALLSRLLLASGFEVHIVSVLNVIDYKYGGELLNLGILKERDDSFLGRIKRFLHFRNFIRDNKFDYLIDNRTRHSFLNEFIISRFAYKNLKVIYMVHSSKLEHYLGPGMMHIKAIYSKAYRVVTVSKALQQAVEKRYGLKNVMTLYNAVENVNEDEVSRTREHHEPYALYFGRLENVQKNLKFMLKAYSLSKLPSEGVKLYLMGDGPHKEDLQVYARELGLQEMIVFMDFQKNPFAIVKTSLFTLLSSRFEGYPCSLVESLSLGVPVISVDCPTGPAEIISHEVNGLLVKKYEEAAFANAMNRLIFENKLYEDCRQNAMNSVAHLSENAVSEAWNKVLK